MKILFFGSSQFAVPSLEALASSGHVLCGVVTRPDERKGRGLHLEGTAVKDAALRLGINVFQPPNINSESAIRALKSFCADLFVVIAYGQILSTEVLNIPKIFSINSHASLLPKYRGAAPINWAIINGESVTGISIIKLNTIMDAGAVILQKKISINNTDTFAQLSVKLSGIAKDALLEVLPLIESNNFQLIEQDNSLVTSAPKLKKEDGLIDWGKNCEEIVNLIRGVFPWPGAVTYYKGKLLKITKAVCLEDASLKNSQAGQIISVSKDSFTVACGKGGLLVLELQIAGKRVMKSKEFIAGHKISAGERLSKNSCK